MNTILEIITDELRNIFKNKNYDFKRVNAAISNRPDLCEFQCNACMMLAKQLDKKPIDLANEIVADLKNSKIFAKAEAVMPGFINLNVDKVFLKTYLQDMKKSKNYGFEKKDKKLIVLDFGGPNVAKPLHVGHLRSAIIGESIKRILKFADDRVISDVHLGDWGLQIGLIIEELRHRKPDLVYFDKNFIGEYPKLPPFTIEELEDIYPCASKKIKYTQDASSEEIEKAKEFKEKAMQATYKLQNGDKAFRAIWKHIIDVSVNDLKRNYKKLDVSFDLWKGESDANDYIKELIDILKNKNICYESDGALVVDVSNPDDKTQIPPCLILKSDGASLYATSDLATIIQRQKDYKPDEIIYITDIRQSLHFEQVFRVVRKAGILEENQKLIHIGFGTVNGKDAKPFKTRDGGVMRLENLIKDVSSLVYEKIKSNRDIEDKKAKEIADIVGAAALKYADLSNQASKDYIFDMEKFTSFEGNTGPYILYTIVRIKSILNKYYKDDIPLVDIEKLKEAKTDIEKNLFLELSKFNEVIKNTYNELAPNKLCQYIYSLANCFNSFYHDINILATKDESDKQSYISLISLTKDILDICIDMLGIKAPDYM